MRTVGEWWWCCVVRHRVVLRCVVSCSCRRPTKGRVMALVSSTRPISGAKATELTQAGPSPGVARVGIQSSPVQSSPVQPSPHCAAPHRTAPHRIAPHCIAPHRIASHCTAHMIPGMRHRRQQQPPPPEMCVCVCVIVCVCVCVCVCVALPECRSRVLLRSGTALVAWAASTRLVFVMAALTVPACLPACSLCACLPRRARPWLPVNTSAPMIPGPQSFHQPAIKISDPTRAHFGCTLPGCALQTPR